MGASRKLQGEIDRVLKKVQEGVDVFDSIWNKVYDTENANQKEKFEADLKKEIKKLQRYRDQIKTWIQSSEIKDKKVSASYEQALLDARKLIEREMERFKVCEKETKTKAFSKEGLGLQPKTDPKEKAKSETRDWLNNVVGELESQIDNFEAELEGLFVKKGKTRPPRLTHLETSILRHKAHIMKLELILRLLDNDELSPEQVNDVRDFLEDYVERNQEDFDDFADVDDLYSTLPLDKVESLEDLVSIPPGLVKGTSVQEHGDEVASQDIDSDVPPKTPSSKNGVIVSVSSSGISSVTTVPSNSILISGNISSRGSVGGSNPSTIHFTAGIVSSSPAHLLEDKTNIPGRKPSPAPTEIGLGRSVDRGSVAGVISTQASSSAMNLVSTTGTGIPASASTSITDIAKRSLLDSEERAGTTGLAQSIGSPLSTRTALQQIPKTGEAIGSMDLVTASDGSVIAGRSFSPSTVSGSQWRPQTPSSFQNPTELGQFRGRPEIAPDQREKFLQRLQQVQQQTHGNLLGATSVPGFNSQNTSISPQIGQGSGVQASNLAAITSSSLQQLGSSYQQPSQHAMLSSGLKDSDTAQVKGEDQQLLLYTTPDVLNAETNISSGFNKTLGNEDDPKASYVADIPAASASLITESTQHSRDTDLSPGQPIQLNQSSSRLGVIGRRSVSDLGAIGENLVSLENSGVLHDHLYNLQMLDAAYYKLPQPKDSERPRNYVPKHPAVTPASYPQVQAPIIDNPAFWDRLSVEPTGIDILFFAFYYQQNTYQQYLAARELKRQSWRYHRKYNTWFQRHEEPKVTTDDFEQGTYVYFDFHNANDESQHGWCQRIKTEFTFEYSFLEDELVV